MRIYLRLLVFIVSGLALIGCSSGNSESGNFCLRPRDDAALAEATQQAKANWKEFATAFATKNGESFFVKAPFEDGEEVEHMWIEVSKLDSKNITGILNNKPEMVSNVSMGQSLTIPVEKVEDWTYKLNNVVRGGYSIKVFEKQKSWRNQANSSPSS